MKRKYVTRSVALGAVLAATVASSAAATQDTTPAAGSGAAAAPAVPQEIIDGCTAEKKVNLIALPDTWANYKEILQSFRDKYPGVENPVASPDASSQEELDAVKNLAGQADMPDNLDVSPAKAQIALTEKMWAPYKPSTFDQIPDNMKDADGNFVNAYYGVLSFGTNLDIAKVAPTSFADLKKPDYKGMVALNGDPRKAGAAFAAVMAASLANGGSADDIMPGIQFFADLKKAGNLIDTEVEVSTVKSGETPIAIDWSYNYPALAAELEAAGVKVSVSYPTDATYGAPYAQGAVANSPHPNCAKLWVEHILSDEGAIGYAKGGAIPARFQTLVDSGKLTADMMTNLPSAELIAKVTFLTADQTAAAAKALEDNWGPMVADA